MVLNGISGLRSGRPSRFFPCRSCEGVRCGCGQCLAINVLGVDFGRCRRPALAMNDADLVLRSPLLRKNLPKGLSERARALALAGQAGWGWGITGQQRQARSVNRDAGPSHCEGQADRPPSRPLRDARQRRQWRQDPVMSLFDEENREGRTRARPGLREPPRRSRSRPRAPAPDPGGTGSAHRRHRRLQARPARHFRSDRPLSDTRCPPPAAAGRRQPRVPKVPVLQGQAPHSSGAGHPPATRRAALSMFRSCPTPHVAHGACNNARTIGASH